MGHPAKNTSDKFTYADYLHWPEDDRYELIQGIAIAHAAPNTAHQRIAISTGSQFYNHLFDKKCEVFVAPYDVVLAEKNKQDFEKEDIVQPDIVVICDPEIITSRGCEGIPDLIIEILSPGTYKKDLNDKYQLYEAKGVKEYWVVSPGDESVVVYLLDENGVYRQGGIYYKEDKVPVACLKGFEIDLTRIFT